VTGPRAVGAALVLLGALAGCGSDGPSRSTSGDPGPTTAVRSTEPASPASPTGSSAAATERPEGRRIITADSEYGAMLYDAGGQPIYLFTAEPGGRPACYDACADDWPPVLTTGAPRAAAGVRAELLGTTRRTDGSTQVTYAGHPLYHYAHEGSYEVLCHDVEEYGGTWWVVRPDGTPAPA